jgi:hypothetical protein
MEDNPRERDEWTRVFNRLDPADRLDMYRLMSARLWARRRRRRGLWPAGGPPPLPRPVCLPLLHAGLTFACLGLLPTHPLSIPVALEAGFALSFYYLILARGRRNSAG